MTQTPTERLHIVEGTDWKDAVIALLESRSPYRPWRYGFGDAHQGDPVAIVLNTDPPSVLTALGRIGVDGRPDRAEVEWPYPAPRLIDLATLTMIVGFPHDQDPRDAWQLHGDAATRMELALASCAYRDDTSMRVGRSSVAAARILLHSRGRCTGCDSFIDLSGEDARDVVHIRTVDPPTREAPEVLIQEATGHSSYIDGPYPPKSWLPQIPRDWPGLLCQRCVTRMYDDGYRSLVDFRFSQHPKCPRCGADRTQSAMFGMPVSEAVHRCAPPWIDWRGCCRTDDIWTCTYCAHKW